jgi:serine/threonine protein kinase
MTPWNMIEANPAPPVDALSIALQIVHALKYCESHGIDAHQDLKPENIFLDGTGHICGSSGEAYPVRHLVFVADLELDDAYRRTDVASGSPTYMAPEQHDALTSGHAGADFSKVDVFAIGVILLVMWTGAFHPVGQRRSLIWPTQSPGHENGSARRLGSSGSNVEHMSHQPSQVLSLLFWV